MIQSKVRSLDELLALRTLCAEACQRVVWTNGCFDLIHVGHIRSFRAARALGDILVVGINSDASVKAIKGELRPIVCQDDRAETVAAIESVDYVTIFDDTEPSAILARLKPDIHCKGADYADGKRPFPERDVVLGYGGRIEFLPLYEGRSTSGLIARICAAELRDRS